MKQPKKKKPTKKRNAQDATIRNIRALKKRVEKMELIIAHHEELFEALAKTTENRRFYETFTGTALGERDR